MHNFYLFPFFIELFVNIFTGSYSAPSFGGQSCGVLKNGRATYILHEHSICLPPIVIDGSAAK